MSSEAWGNIGEVVSSDMIALLSAFPSWRGKIRESLSSDGGETEAAEGSQARFGGQPRPSPPADPTAKQIRISWVPLLKNLTPGLTVCRTALRKVRGTTRGRSEYAKADCDFHR